MIFYPSTSPGEGVAVFTYPYLSAGAPAQGEAKGLIKKNFFGKIIDKLKIKVLLHLKTNQK